MQLLGGPAHEAAGFVVGRFDDEGIALPVSTRIAKPLTDDSREVGIPIQRDHTSVVNHFQRNRHRIGRLDNLVGALVSGHQARRPVGDAAFLQCPIGGLRGHPPSARLASRICVPSGVIGGMRPSGGSVIKDVRFSQSLSTVQTEL